MKEKIFYLSLRTQYENLGDYMICQATIEVLSKLGTVYVDTRRVPERYLKLFSENDKVKFTKLDFITYLIGGAAATYVVKAGGYSSEKTILGVAKKLCMASYFRVARLLGGRAIRMPHSFHFGSKYLWVERMFARSFDLILCRDSETADSYKKITDHKVMETDDMAIVFSGTRSVFSDLRNLPRRYIAVAVRYDRPSSVEHIKMKVDDILKKEKLDVVIVSQVELDHSMSMEVSKLWGGVRVCIYNQTHSSISDITQIYAESKYVVSNRLHALILGALNGADPVPIMDKILDRKVTAYAEKMALINPAANGSTKGHMFNEQIADLILAR